MKQLSKTNLILAICLWAGNGTSLLKASTPIRQIHSITENPQQRHHRGKQTRQKHIMNDKDFNFLYKTIKKKYWKIIYFCYSFSLISIIYNLNLIYLILL